MSEMTALVTRVCEDVPRALAWGLIAAALVWGQEQVRAARAARATAALSAVVAWRALEARGLSPAGGRANPLGGWE